MHRTSGLRDFSLGAARILRRAVPFEGVCVLTMDPATLVPTGEAVENGLPVAAYARMAEIEGRGEDFNAFRCLALSEPVAATPSQATGGELARSERHREIRSPNGFGDELRAALTDGQATWGALTLLRGSDTAPFSPAAALLVAEVTHQGSEGLRRACLLAPATPEPWPGEDVIVLAADG